MSSTAPESGATDVSVNAMVTATFSEAMDPATIHTNSFTLARGVARVSGTVGYSGVTATFRATEPLMADTMYTATVTTAVEALNEPVKFSSTIRQGTGFNDGRAGESSASRTKTGNAFLSDYTWSFRTGAAPDAIAPRVSGTSPKDGALDVARDGNVTAVFSEALDPTTITVSSFTLSRGMAPVAGTVDYSGVTAMFDPISLLDPYILYTARISVDARDLAGNPLEADYLWSFYTGDSPDTAGPEFLSSLPVDGTTEVAVNSNIVAVFNEWMDPLTVNTRTFTVRSGILAIPGTVSFLYRSGTFNPTDELAPDTLYTAMITTGMTDLSGNALEEDRSWSFTTGANPDTTPPTVNLTYPADGATGASLNFNVVVGFSEVMEPLTINTATFTLRQGIVPVLGMVSYGFSTGVFDPQNELMPNTVYTATVSGRPTDLAGNAIGVPTVWSFTTGDSPDIIAPFIDSIDPADGETDVGTDRAIAVTFSEPMAPGTLTSSTFSLRQGNIAVLGTVTYAGDVAIFIPVSDLAPNLTYTATVSMEASDLAGNMLEADTLWSFSTAN